MSEEDKVIDVTHNVPEMPKPTVRSHKSFLGLSVPPVFARSRFKRQSEESFVRKKSTEINKRLALERKKADLRKLVYETNQLKSKYRTPSKSRVILGGLIRTGINLYKASEGKPVRRTSRKKKRKSTKRKYKREKLCKCRTKIKGAKF